MYGRDRDIMYIDKTGNNIKILNVVTKHHLTLLKELYEIVSSSKLYENNNTSRANTENTLLEKRGFMIMEEDI
jgi:hypothetical protein